MKKIFLFFIFVFATTLIQSQTFTQISNEYLGQLNQPENESLETDYGTFDFKMIKELDKVIKMEFTIDNKNIYYDSIISNHEIESYKVGETTTDIFIKYEPIVTKKFTKLLDALKYLLANKNSEMISYQEVTIYKEKQKEKYFVGRFFISEKSILLSDDGENIGSFFNYDQIN